MKNGQIVNFDVSDGIQGSEFKYNAQCSIAANRMAFGGVNGLTIFNPDSIKFSQVKPCVAFVDFQVLGNSVFPDTKGSPLIQDIDFVESIILSHKQSTFGFTFVSLDYNSPENNRYMYKMEGFDKDWIDGGNNHHAGYANLPPGKYVFMFKGSNSDGIWSDSAREIKIRIKPPWYRTNLVIILITILIGYFIWHLYRRQKDKRDLRDNQILQQKIDEAEKQLQGKIDEIENQKQEINKRDRQDQEIRFFTDGIAGFNVTISGQRRNLGLLCEIAIAELVKYVGASLGAIYLIDDEKQDQPVLIVKGSYNCTLEKIQNAMLHIGEAYPGTCFYDKQTISVDDLPDNYAILSSGLGKIALRHLILVPMIENGQCCGVIEIASMERLDDFKIRFVEKIAESLASTITIIQTNEKYHKIISDKPEHLM
jgi:putative methionine-R-sulfoxide reductase with GAF domain